MIDRNGKEIVLQDYATDGCVGVQIGTFGRKLWVCIDGVGVLRVKAEKIDFTDLRVVTDGAVAQSAEAGG